MSSRDQDILISHRLDKSAVALEEEHVVYERDTQHLAVVALAGHGESCADGLVADDTRCGEMCHSYADVVCVVGIVIGT